MKISYRYTKTRIFAGFQTNYGAGDSTWIYEQWLLWHFWGGL